MLQVTREEHQIDCVQDFFVATLLLVFVHVCSKISVILFVMSINSGRQIKMASFVALAVVAAWGISSIFALALNCHISSLWSSNKGQCQEDFYVYMGVNIGNIITDIALVVLPAVMMWGVQTSFKLKARVIALFASRLL